jgi:hypothetical protein
LRKPQRNRTDRDHPRDRVLAMHDQLLVDCAGVATPEPVTAELGLFYARSNTIA